MTLLAQGPIVCDKRDSASTTLRWYAPPTSLTSTFQEVISRSLSIGYELNLERCRVVATRPLDFVAWFDTQARPTRTAAQLVRSGCHEENRTRGPEPAAGVPLEDIRPKAKEKARATRGRGRTIVVRNRTRDRLVTIGAGGVVDTIPLREGVVALSPLLPQLKRLQDAGKAVATHKPSASRVRKWESFHFLSHPIRLRKGSGTTCVPKTSCSTSVSSTRGESDTRSIGMTRIISPGPRYYFVPGGPKTSQFSPL